MIHRREGFLSLENDTIDKKKSHWTDRTVIFLHYLTIAKHGNEFGGHFLRTY